jgi:integrase
VAVPANSPEAQPSAPVTALRPLNAELVALFEQADALAEGAKADNTLRAYRSDWVRFERWCTVHHLPSLPTNPQILKAYLTDASGRPSLGRPRRSPWRYSAATLERWTAAISWVHERAGYPGPGRHPEVRDVLTSIRRSRATPPRRKAPVLLADLERLLAGFEVQNWPAATGGIRNRCLLLFGWAGALRRSELVALDVSHVHMHREDGLHITLRRSKTDQEAKGRIVPIPFGRKPGTCAPCAWVRWAALLAAFDGSDGGSGGRVGLLRALRASSLGPEHQHACRADRLPRLADEEAPVFRAVRNNGLIGPNRITGEAVNQVIQRAASRAGLGDLDLGGHSLRSGFVTQAFRNGADAHAIMRQTRHTNPATLEVYARENVPLLGNAVTQVGL